MSDEAPKRKRPTGVIVAVAVAALLSLYLLSQGFWTFVIFWAIVAPILIAGALVVLGNKPFPGGLLWLAGAGFATVPAAYMSFSSLCERGQGSCPELTNSHKALWALIALGIGWVVLFAVRSAAGRMAFVGLATFGMVWMILRMRTGEEMIFAAVMLVILLVFAIIGELVKYLRARAVEKELQVIAAGGSTPAA
jgi:hypothetical protein